MRRRTLLMGAGSAALLGLAAIRPARADTLDAVKTRGTLVVGLEAEYVPYEFYKDGKIVGYDPDIIQHFVDKLGVKVQLVDTAWNGIIPALYAGKFDLIISGMTITKERAKKVLFAMPYADASAVIMVRAGEDRIKTAEDLSGKVLGVGLGSAAYGIIKTFEARLKAEGKPGYAEIKQYQQGTDSYQDLINHRIDATVNAKSNLLAVMRTAPGQFKLVPGISNIHAYFGMAFRKGDARLQAFVNEQLAQMKTDGELAKLQEKWFGDTMKTPNTVPDILP
jgi:polar amino acid transport system substrate-binding protein